VINFLMSSNVAISTVSLATVCECDRLTGSHNGREKSLREAIVALKFKY
jgi:hypothetical protein